MKNFFCPTASPIKMKSWLPGSALQKLCRVLQNTFSHAFTADHSGDLLDSLAPIQMDHSNQSSSIFNSFFDAVMIVGVGSDLRQVSHTENLVATRQLLELLPDNIRSLSPNTRIDFVK